MSRMRHRAKAIRYAAASLAIGLMVAGSGAASARDHGADRTAAKTSRAVAGGEAAVAKAPTDAAARLALAQLYLEAGRFQSAAATFGDALALGDTSSRTQLSLALAEIGAGDSHSAVALLDAARDTIPATDRGLALALAGETSRGTAILFDALRAGENTAKLRQNLAYAYALDGRWHEARITMAQDVPADQIDDRISNWATLAQPEAVQQRVAALLGVPAGVQDAGQPASLALSGDAAGERMAAVEPAVPAAAAELPALDQAAAAQPAAAPAFAAESAAVPAVAAADPVATPQIAAADPVAVSPAAPAPASADPAPAGFTQAFLPEPAAAAAAEAQSAFASQPVVQAVAVQQPAAPKRAALAKPQARQALTTARPGAALHPVAAVGTGTHLVQLGSFSNEANARRAWRVFTARNPELRSYRMTITPAVVNGKNFWRVAAGGLDGSSAQRVCSGVKNRGGACLSYGADHAPAGERATLALAGSAAARARRR